MFLLSPFSPRFRGGAGFSNARDAMPVCTLSAGNGRKDGKEKGGRVMKRERERGDGKRDA